MNWHYRKLVPRVIFSTAQAGTNETSTTLSRYEYHHVHFHSIAHGPTFDPIHLQLYRSRAVCLVFRLRLRMVLDRLDTYTLQNENIRIE